MDELKQVPKKPGNRERLRQCREREGRREEQPMEHDDESAQLDNRRVIIAASTIIVVLLIVVLVTVTAGLDIPIDKIGENRPLESAFQPEPEIVNISLVAAGDNLIHNTIYQQAATRAGHSGYDFTYAYEAVAPLLEGKDIAFINQETPLACAIYEPSNYPLFNTPTESVQALHAIGFNVFNLASNHTYDRGADGMLATIEAMATLPTALAVGAYRDETDLHQVRKMTIDGVDVAFVGLTEMTNGLSLPADSPLELILTGETEKVQTAIREAKAAADVVIVSVHWGEENVTTANDSQRAFGRQLAEWGADLVIGHHPHVLQEIEILDVDGRQVPVVYSLGNFISAMSNQANHVGGLFGCTIEVNKANGAVTIKEMEFIPTICYFSSGYDNIKVVPLSAYTAEMSNSHGKGVTSEYAKNLLQQVIGPAYLDGNKVDALPPTTVDDRAPAATDDVTTDETAASGNVWHKLAS